MRAYRPHAVAVLSLLGLVAFGLTPSAAVFSAEPQATIVRRISGLRHPCALAVQPHTDAVFVADNGHGRIVRFAASPSAPAVDTQVQDVVVGFPHEAASGEFPPRRGPLSLAFQNSHTLIVAEAGPLPNGPQATVGRYPVPAPDQPALKWQDAQATRRPLSSQNSPDSGWHGFGGLLVTRVALFALGQHDDGTRSIQRAAISGSDLSGLESSFLNHEANARGAPTSLAMSPRGELLVSHRGSGTSGAPRSSLAFYHADTGEQRAIFEVDLTDVTGMAFSPKTGRLYAVNYGRDPAEAGGLYRIDAVQVHGKPSVQATRILTLVHPNGLAFSSHGALFITLWGAIDGQPVDRTNDAPAAGNGAVVEVTAGL